MKPAGNRREGAAGFSLKEKLARLRLARTDNVGPVTFHKFMKYYGAADRAIEAVPALAARGGRKKPLSVPPLHVAEREYEAVRKLGGDILCCGEEDYPPDLAATEDAPPVLAVIGNPALLRRPCLAVVGARNASLSGRSFARALAKDLGAAGYMVVSGLARGIDTAAHEGALDTGTAAVLAGGIDVVYPPENRKLYDSIAARGLIVAENPPGMPPRAQDFPRRNRIVSGLSSGVIVVEATERSGSLITARLAAEQGRDVYAVPGHPADPRAAGPNRLIREGAVLVRGAQDVLEAAGGFRGGLALEDPVRQEILLPPDETGPDADDARRIVLDSLSFTPLDIDGLIRAAGLDAALAHAVLLELELAGAVQRLSGNRAVLMSDQGGGG